MARSGTASGPLRRADALCDRRVSGTCRLRDAGSDRAGEPARVPVRRVRDVTSSPRV